VVHFSSGLVSPAIADRSDSTTPMNVHHAAARGDAGARWYRLGTLGGRALVGLLKQLWCRVAEEMA
jgi:hypothetical protein